MSLQAIHEYHNEVEKIIHFGGTKKETAIRNAFYHLLNIYAKQKGLMLVPEVTIKTPKGKNVTPDGTLKDSLRQDWGYWESKDEADDINEEIKKKFAKDYPRENILFEDSQTAVLYQSGVEVQRVKMKDEAALDRLIHSFINFERPEVKHFHTAIELFKQDIPKVTDTLRDLLETQETTNPKFVKERNKFLKLCHDSINPEVTPADVREMMIQHILTEDIFNTVFDETQFHRENNIARQLETVISTFFTGATKKTALSRVQHYYQAINAAAAGIADHHEKQNFLKVVYETFYKSYNPKAADRLGVVYTPNEIVRFMIESTDYLLNKHFGRFLEDKGVDILDPATGTGTFICDIIDHISKAKLEYKYKHELHANEVAILPYYISNLNIEFTYNQKMKQYAEFQNLCFVDTLDNMGFAYRGKQIDMFAPFTEENSKRIKNQNNRKIAVVIGNPPYNANQANYNDYNKNRDYPQIDKRIKETYVKYSNATNKANLFDMYTRFLRWASDRLDENGIIAFVSNNSFIDSKTFDGFRKVIGDEFQHCYIVNLKGDARTSGERRRMEGGNVFSNEIRVGIAIYFFVRKKGDTGCTVYYDAVKDYAKADEKLEFVSERDFKEIPFEHIKPDKGNNWINIANNDFEDHIPIAGRKNEKALFHDSCLGIDTHRDLWVYDHSKNNLKSKIDYLIDVYTQTLKNPAFAKKNTIAWSRELKKYYDKDIAISYDKDYIKKTLYRPFFSCFHYSDKYLNSYLFKFPIFFSGENKAIAINIPANNRGFMSLATATPIDLHFVGDSRCLPLFNFDESGNRVENITDWGLNKFIKHYGKKGINKEAIFYYTYAVLNNPMYREKYELNLKREFPRIPFYKEFKQWSEWGKVLMDLHINYENVLPFKLAVTQLTAELKDVSTYQLYSKAKLKADKAGGRIVIDGFTTLTGIPPEAWTYRLGNQSALEWVLDQYKESKPKDPTIAEKFNTYRFADYKEQVIDLLKRVTTVSVETMKIIEEMKAAQA